MELKCLKSLAVGSCCADFDKRGCSCKGRPAGPLTGNLHTSPAQKHGQNYTIDRKLMCSEAKALEYEGHEFALLGNGALAIQKFIIAAEICAPCLKENVSPKCMQ